MNYRFDPDAEAELNDSITCLSGLSFKWGSTIRTYFKHHLYLQRGSTQKNAVFTMTTCSIDQELLDELIDFKLRHLLLDINDIIDKWGYADATKFINDARNGVLQEAEMDAISLRQLVHDREELERIKTGWHAKK
jgi:hypothetical protein